MIQQKVAHENNTVIVMISRATWITALLSLLTVNGGCDTHKSGTEIDLVPQSEVLFESDYGEVRLESDGAVFNGIIRPQTDNPDIIAQLINRVGLWMAGLQESVRANVSYPYLPNYYLNRFGFIRPVSEGGGLYKLSTVDVGSGISNWPVQDGAPANSDGSPKIYGDHMVWGAFTPVSDSGSSDHGLHDINVGMSWFAFDDGPLKSTLFVRYEVSNNSEEPVSELYLGYGGDYDLHYIRNSVPSCDDLRVSDNQQGYDMERDMSYIYMKRTSTDPDYVSSCYGTLVGFTILPMQSEGGLSQSIHAHRAIYRFSFEGQSEAFYEGSLRSAEQIRLALQGLSSAGDPMIDPSSGNVTKFAFSGDPVTETGWIDSRRDVRSLLSIDPIDLDAGESVSMTVAIVWASENSFTEGLTSLKDQMDAVYENRELWDY